MTKALVTSPFNKISDRPSSHRSAQAFIYAQQLIEHGRDVTVDTTGTVDVGQYDEIYVYHGNDWGGTLNMFGGPAKWDGIERLQRFTTGCFGKKVYSLAIPFPDYAALLHERLSKATPEVNARWPSHIVQNLGVIQANSSVVDTNFGTGSHILIHRERDKIVVGDSHAISHYRPGWMVNSVPYSTLYGSLKKGLDTFVHYDPILSNHQFNHAELYFGNIDIRHHLCRQEKPTEASRLLASDYYEAAFKLAHDIDARIGIVEPLPIENESRKVPTTGFYKGTPFYGTWEQRDEVRRCFISQLHHMCSTLGAACPVYIKEWTKPLMNDKGELSFDAMEKPKSVHLGRYAYPDWQGLGINTTSQQR